VVEGESRDAVLDRELEHPVGLVDARLGAKHAAEYAVRDTQVVVGNGNVFYFEGD
jgi:hypothetical protein